MVKNRLAFMSSSIYNSDTYNSDESNYEGGFSFLNQMTCLESVEDQSSLQNCLNPVSEIAEFNQVLEFRKKWLVAGMMLQEIASGDADQMASMKDYVKSMDVENVYVGLPYDLEMQFLTNVIDANPEMMDEVLEKELKVHPGVEYSH